MNRDEALARSPGTAGNDVLPSGFLALLMLIAVRTLSMFLRRLPVTVLFGVAGMLFHTYLLVFINEGFGSYKSSRIVSVLWINQNDISSAIIWTVGSAVVMGLLSRIFSSGRKRKRATLRQRVAAVVSYIRLRTFDAYAVIAASIGLTLVMGALVNKTANLTLALGAGALLVSRAGSVVALLVRTAWNNAFTMFRSKTMKEHGVAIGYVGLFAGSAGFLVSSMLTPSGNVLGVILLVGALAFAVLQRIGITGLTGLLLIAALLPVVAVLLGVPGIALAHDGGWIDTMGNVPLTPENIIIYLQRGGSATALAHGIAPGAASAAGAALAQALNALGQSVPSDTDGVADGGETAAERGGDGQRDQGPELVDPRTGKTLIVNDGKTYEGGKPGQVWLDGQWMDRSEAQWNLDQIQQDLDRESQRIREDQRRFSDQWARDRENKVRAEGYVFDKDKDAWVQGPNDQRKPSEYEIQEETNRRILRSADKIGNQVSGSLQERIDELRDSGRYEELAELCRDYWRGQIREGQQESRREQRWATAYGIAEVGAKATVAASRGALMTLGGPAGLAATAVSVGAVSAAQEGAETYVAGGDALDVAKSTAAGFLSGAKDGAIGHYVNLPSTSSAVKVLLPAASDTAETFIRTGDVKRSLATGAVSAAGDIIGLKTEGMAGDIKKELISAATSAASGGALNVINGGDFGEGAVDGLINHVGGRIGAAGVEHAARAPENLVRQAQGEVREQRSQVIKTEGQPDVIRQLNDSRYQKVQVDEDGRIKVDDNGDPVVEDRVSTRRALEQLQDTGSSRTAKQAEPDLQDAIIKTREQEIYAPADKRTISRAEQKPEIQDMMKPGDKLVMDTFSTPGSKPSLGADRDARLVIQRPDGEKVEVPRRHWEKDAYKDFYDHSMEITGGRDNVTPESHPEFFRRREELDYLKGPGMSQEDIDARAWGEAHNQLFTDRHHMEASRANSDQAVRVTAAGLERGSETPNVLRTQHGEATLQDPGGFARMWGEKSRFYEHNTPEAVAQAQKGIEQQMKIRDGLRSQEVEPPPLPMNTAKAMELITRAPVGADATPDAMAQLNQNLQDLGYRDTNDAIQRIASQNEAFKWSQSKLGLSPGQTIRVARDTLGPQEPEEPQAPEDL